MHEMCQLVSKAVFLDFQGIPEDFSSRFHCCFFGGNKCWQGEYSKRPFDVGRIAEQDEKLLSCAGNHCAARSTFAQRRKPEKPSMGYPSGPNPDLGFCSQFLASVGQQVIKKWRASSVHSTCSNDESALPASVGSGPPRFFLPRCQFRDCRAPKPIAPRRDAF